MEDLFALIGKAGLMPVLTVEKEEDARPIAEALMAGGLPLAEITLRTAAAAKAITAMAKVPGLLPGAGTVLRPEQVDQAMDAGARFGLAPNFNPKTAARALEKKFPFIPGVMTPSEMAMAMEMGFSVVKFFPAEPAGGAAFLKAVSAPLKGIRFVPTGGIAPDSLPSYLEIPSVLCVGGSWVATPKLIREKKFGEITRLAKQAVETVQKSRANRA